MHTSVLKPSAGIQREGMRITQIVSPCAVHAHWCQNKQTLQDSFASFIIAIC